MTFEINKSFIRDHIPDFEVLVAAHAREMSDWLAREQRVAQDANNPNIPDIDRWVSCPMPEAPNGWVGSAVDETGTAHYTIVDDGPTADQILAAKKDALVQALNAAQASAMNDVLPINKRPLRDMVAADIAKSDASIREEIVNEVQQNYIDRINSYNAEVASVMGNGPGIMTRMAAKIGVVEDPVKAAIDSIAKPEPEKIDLEAEVASRRDASYSVILEENARLAEADITIARNAAKALHDIDDLTSESIDAYQIPDLKKQG